MTRKTNKHSSLSTLLKMGIFIIIKACSPISYLNLCPPLINHHKTAGSVSVSVVFVLSVTGFQREKERDFVGFWG